jgi:Tol biopolymer transport system component
VSRLDGSGKKVLTEPRVDAAPVWSPDGTRIAFVRGSGEAGTGDVYIVGADGKGERRVAVGGSPVWLRDGRLLISRDKGFAIADVDPDRIAMPVDGGNAVVSPDGGSIAFLRERAVHTGYLPPDEDLLAVQSTLFVQRSAGTDVRELAKTAGTEAEPLVFGGPVWAPDGQSILIEEHDPMAGGRARIRQIPIRGRDERTVAREDFSNLELVAVAPDGERIAFATDDSIDVVELDGNKRENVAPLDRVYANDLKWSPGGEKLAYVASDFEREDVYELYVMNADGSDRRLVSKQGDAVGTFDWAP